MSKKPLILSNKRLNVSMLIILILCLIRLITHSEQSPVVADWMSFIGTEFALQVLWTNLKT